MRRDIVMVSPTEIGQRILSLRGQKVMLDSDLADLYGVTTKRLNEQVRRNLVRFPQDFMFQLSAEEAAALRSQNATSKGRRGGRRYAPYAFTEYGALMLASVLNSAQAIEVSVYVARAFVRLRHVMVTSRVMAEKLRELEQRLSGHDEAMRSLVTAVRRLMDSPPRARIRRPIGFRVEEGRPSYGLPRRRRPKGAQ